MNRIFFAALLYLPTLSQAAMAPRAEVCGGLGYSWLDISLRADGNIDRISRPRSDNSELVSDRYYLRYPSDSVSLVASLYAQGASNTAQVELLEQVSDTYEQEGKTLKGVFASLYKITKISTPVVPNPQTTTEVEYVRVDNNYLGNGRYTRGCGGFQAESDRSKIKMPEKP